MRVEDPGHYYVLDSIDRESAQVERNDVRLYFVKRIGEGYPGNEGNSLSGPLCQEVIRALIDRLSYLDAQQPSELTKSARRHLRGALLDLEVRAAEERDDSDAAAWISTLTIPELVPTCSTCGHLRCSRHP